MALSANTTFEIRTTGADTNGGGFVTGASGVDYSQQDAAQFSGTDLVIDAVTNTKVTSATHNFVANDVGNLIQITAGSGFTTGFFQIVSVASNIATLDRSAGTLGSTGGTWAEGGALATPGKAAGATSVDGQKAYIKSGTYTITTTTANVSNGRVSLGNIVRWEGYQTTRGDYGTTPVLQASGISATTLFAVTHFGIGTVIINIGVDGNSIASMNGFDLHGGIGYRLLAHHCPGTGITSGVQGVVAMSWGHHCGTGINASQAVIVDCTTNNNTGVGLLINNNCLMAVNCLSYSNTGVNFSSGAFNVTFVNCTSYGSASHGFTFFIFGTAINCIAEGNGGYGFSTGSGNAVIVGCATYNNTSGAFNPSTPSAIEGNITGSGSFFTDAASGDFSLNNTSGAGALLRNTALPTIFPAGLTTYNGSIGAAQLGTAVASSGGSYAFA